MAEKWELHKGFSDWGLPCQHEIMQGDEQIAGIPSITPYCMGAKVEDKEYAARQWANAKLFLAAPDLLEACKEALGAFENNNAIDWNVLSDAIAKAEGK